MVNRWKLALLVVLFASLLLLSFGCTFHVTPKDLLDAYDRYNTSVS